MAVAKSRRTPSTRGMRRSHDSLKTVQLSTDPTSGEVHLRHHVTKDGYYRGKKVIETKGAVSTRIDRIGPATGRRCEVMQDGAVTRRFAFGR